MRKKNKTHSGNFEVITIVYLKNFRETFLHLCKYDSIISKENFFGHVHNNNNR